MQLLLTVIFVLVCVLLVVSILLQSAKGEGLSGTFGGTGQFMGGRAAATFLTKATTILATAFVLLALLLRVSYDDGSAGVKTSAQEALSGRDAEATPIVPAPPGVGTAPVKATPEKTPVAPATSK
jgi:preprotein translocase subunit SecG